MLSTYSTIQGQFLIARFLLGRFPEEENWFRVPTPMEGPLGNFFLRLGPASIPWQAPVKQDGSIAPSRPKQISRTSPSPELLKSFIRLLRNEMRDSRHLAATGSKRVVRFPIFWCVSHRLTSSHFKGQRTCHLKRATFGPQTRQRASYSMIEASKTPLAPQTGVSKLIGDSASIKRATLR